MKGTIRWAGEVKFEAESGSGHTLVIDGPPEYGGQNQGVRPMELILLGLGGCSAFDVIHILKKARQDVTDCVAHLDAERVDTVPSVFKKIHLHFVITGRNLRDTQVKRAVELSAEKYCSASIMLSKGGVDISHSYEVKAAE